MRKIRPSSVLPTRSILRVVAALLVTSSVASAQSEQVTVSRDGHGVVHLSAPSDKGAFYGAGWAHAEDRLFQMCLHRLIYQGRVAEFLGAGPPGGGNDYIELDRYHRILGWDRHVAKEEAMLSPELKGLLDSFARGVTDYMIQVRAGNRPEHSLFATTGVPLNEDWTAQDSLGLWLRMSSNFRKIDWNEPKNRFQIDADLAAGKTQAEIIAATASGKCDDDAAVIQPGDLDPALVTAMGNYAAAKGLSSAANCAGGIVPPPPHFSHAWAIGSSQVVEGVAVLMSDPRLPLTIPNSLYEWHMIGATFDTRGAGIPGVPYFLVGSNPSVAWGATALGPDQADLFKMNVDLTADPSTYQLNYEMGSGLETVNMIEERIDIKVAGGATQHDAYRETYYGPLVTRYVNLAAGQTLGPNEEYALKALPMSHPELCNLQGFLDMYRATDVQTFRTALEGLVFPAINVVFADDTGSIGYVANGGFPVRANGAFLAGYGALDGTTVANDWQELLPHDFKPWVIDPADGKLFSANHQPIASFYPLPFVSGSRGEENRSWRLRQLIDDVGAMTIQEIADIHQSAVMPDAVAVTVVAQTIQGIDASFPTNASAQAGLPHLSAWLAAGGEMTNAHPATYLASRVEFRFPAGVTQSIKSVYGGKGVIPFLKVMLGHIDVGTFAPNAAEKEAVQLIIADAYQRTVAENGGSTNPVVWQAAYQAEALTSIYTSAKGNGSAPWVVEDSYPSTTGGAANGVSIVGDPSLPSFSHGQPRCTESGTIMEQGGQSYTQFVIPGIPNAVLSVLTPGVREIDFAATAPIPPVDISGNTVTMGQPIDRNQEPLWSGIGTGTIGSDLKWFPTTAGGVPSFTGGFLSVEYLTFVP